MRLVSTGWTMMPGRYRVTMLAAGIVGMFCILAGCGRSLTTEQFIERARASREAGDPATAIVMLKNALAQDPRNLTARLLYAQLSLDVAEGDAAQGLLFRAVADGATKLQVVGPLAEAEFLAQRYEDVVSDTAEPPNEASVELRASLLASRGSAMIALGQLEEARGALREGYSIAPRSVDLLTAYVRLELAKGDLAAAREWLAKAKALACRSDMKLVHLEGDIAFAGGDPVAAERAYRKIAAAVTWSPLPLTDVAWAQLSAGKLDEVIASTNEVLGILPKDPKANYLRAVAEFRRKDFEAAQSYAEATILGTFDFPPARLIAGAASYALGQYERARYYLGIYVYRAPDDLEARKLLAGAQLRLGRSREAMATLGTASDHATEDDDLLALIGVAAARSGDPAAANRYLTRAVARQPDNSALRVELAKTDLALGGTQAGVAELEEVLKADPKALGAQISLYLVYLRNKEYDKALGLAEQVAKSQPDATTGATMAAAADLARGDIAAGRAAFLKVREIDRGDVSANSNLAKLALSEGRPEEARQYYNDILSRNPKSTLTYLDLAALEDRVGHPQEAEAALERGLQANPDDFVMNVALVRVALDQGHPQQAVEAGQRALKKFPRNEILLETIGRAQLALGQTADALATFQSWADAAPETGLAHRYLAEAYMAGRTSTASPEWKAIVEAEEAVKLASQDKVAKLTLARALLTNERIVGAREIADQLKQTDPDNLAVIELDGLVARAQGQLPDAIAAFTRAVKQADNGADRRRLAEAQFRAGQAESGVDTLRRWLEAHPDDGATRQFWAELSISSGRLAEASEQFAELVRQNPASAIIRNNFAWTLARQGKAPDALVEAREAARLAPDSPDILDTLGAILWESGKAAEAVDDFTRAMQHAPDRRDIRFHLAQALADTGHTGEALDLVRGLLEAGDQPFNERTQAQQLLRRLGG
jgi:putative PEP-CTERM system TPR-repeat lipoprotein